MRNELSDASVCARRVKGAASRHLRGPRLRPRIFNSSRRLDVSKSGAYLTAQRRDQIHECVLDSSQLLRITPRLHDFIQVVTRPGFKGE